MSNKGLLYIAVACLGLILLAQTYLVLDYFNTTRVALSRESDAILKETFHRDLNKRNKLFQQTLGLDTIAYSPEVSPEKSITVDARENNMKDDDFVNNLDVIINIATSQTVPLNVYSIDSITQTILQTRKIHSDFVIARIDSTGKTIESSHSKSRAGLFSISSAPLLINPKNSESLQLTLINPFGVIVKRMALMLISSFAFALICIVAFVKLMRILARQKELMAVKNDFFGTTAHELKRPVARLRMAIDSLGTERVYTNREKKERYLAISKEAVNEMSSTIQMILALSMAEEGVFELSITEFDLIPIICQLKGQFVSTSSKAVEINTPELPERLAVRGDETHIRQTIANLIDNAIKYSGEKVTITIKVVSEAKNVLVTVIDNGVGIAPEKQELVFEKYTRIPGQKKSISGFGIGLSYVKAVIEKHGGSISLRSQIDRGSEFVFSLPRAA
ncbi:MAG: HAMP domain-containing sensor histidine kinase [Dysgonamonadaceae bacterium]